MIDIREEVEKIQKKPYETRVRILWVIVLVCGVILIGLWVLSLKNTLKGVDKSSLIAAPTANTQTEKNDIVSVERIETTGDELKIYFNVENNSDDIINLPKTNDIELNGDELSFHPLRMTDRQGNPFVQKVLSHTKNFGILIFGQETVSLTQADLTFNQMFFEKTDTQYFKQELNLDLTKLNENGKLRN